MNDLIPIVKISGEVCYNGRNIFDKDVDVNELRRDVGMVFQKPNPFPMSIYDNIAYIDSNIWKLWFCRFLLSQHSYLECRIGALCYTQLCVVLCVAEA